MAALGDIMVNRTRTIFMAILLASFFGVVEAQVVLNPGDTYVIESGGNTVPSGGITVAGGQLTIRTDATFNATDPFLMTSGDGGDIPD